MVVDSMLVGDAEAIARVCAVYDWDHERLWRSIYAFSGSRHIADEAVAEAFALALQRGNEVRDVTNGVWRAAFVIARRELQARRLDPSADEPAPADPIGQESPGDGLADIITQLGTLGHDDRELLVWCQVGGWTPKELAPLLGMRATTIRVRLQRATRAARTIPPHDGAESHAGAERRRLTEPSGQFGAVPVPDQWDDIIARAEAAPPAPGDDRGRRGIWMVAAGAIVVVVLLLGLVVVAESRTSNDTNPAPTVPATSEP